MRRPSTKMFMMIISKDYRKIITVNFKLFQMSKTNVFIFRNLRMDSVFQKQPNV